MKQRRGSVSRETAETRISVAVDLDGTGEYRIETGCGMFDHLLAQISRHGLIDLEDMAEGARFFFEEEVEIDGKAAAKFLTPEISGALAKLRGELVRIETFSTEAVKSAFERVLEEEGLKLGKLAQPARVAVTGGTVSPGIFETLGLLGREAAVRRLDAALARIAR